MKKPSAKAWYVVVGLLGVGLGVAASLKPWEKLREQRALAGEARNDLRESQAEHQDLVRRQAQSQTELGQEVQARERGYKEPDEQPWEPKTK